MKSILVISMIIAAFFSPIVFAFTECTSNSDCRFGYVCAIIEQSTKPVCIDGGASACRSYCSGDMYYQTAYSTSNGCSILLNYSCQYGCNSKGTNCLDKPAAPECVGHGDCPGDVCKDGYEMIRICIDGKCVPGETVAYCPNGCASATSCGASVDKCAGVTCPDKCQNDYMMTEGHCDSNSGSCEYTEDLCPAGCDTSGRACKSEPIKVSVFYTDEKGKKVPIRSAKINAMIVKDTRILVDYDGQTDDSGIFNWANPGFSEAGSTVSITLYLENQNNKVYVSSDNDVANARGFVIVDRVSISDPKLKDYQVDLALLKNDEFKGSAKIYATGLKAVEFKENQLRLTPTVEERIVSFSNSGNFHGTERYIDVYPTIGMYLLKKSSDFNNQYLPDTVFHEYGHHIQLQEVFTAKRNPAGSDHAGYFKNPDSEWGLVEGWAEFVALEMKRQYKIERYGLYRIRGDEINLELDYKMDDKFFKQGEPWTPGMVEEMAIAGIFVDLRDGTSDYGNHDDDSVSLPLSTIWVAFNKKRDFGDGQGVRNVYTVRDFYLAMKNETSDYPYMSEPYLRGSNLTNLEFIFVKHGAYQDLNNNRRWDTGEPIGYSGKGSALRSDLEAENGTEIQLDIRDTAGNPLSKGILIQVNVEFNESWLSYSYDVPMSEGAIYAPLPPKEYNATITMTALQAGTNRTATDSFVITSAQAYANIDPTKPLGIYQATLPISAAVLCDSAYQCVYYEAGGYCRSGICSEIEAPTPQPNPQPIPNPNPEPTPECCGSAFILLGTIMLALHKS